MVESSRGVRTEARKTPAAHTSVVHSWRVSWNYFQKREINSNFSEFWRLEIERAKGEVALFLGPKSKHTQFHKMCLDPTNEKFKVEKEDDLQVTSIDLSFESHFQAFWDAMVLPSIVDFCNRVEWLRNASSLNWAEVQKEAKPFCTIGQSPARPSRPRPAKLVRFYLVSETVASIWFLRSWGHQLFYFRQKKRKWHALKRSRSARRKN